MPARSPRRRVRIVATSNVEAARAADIVVLAIPFASAPEVAAEIADGGRRQARRRRHEPDLVRPERPGDRHDASSRTPRPSPRCCPTRASSRRSTRSSPSHQTDPIADGVQLDGFVAGDDAAAKATVLELVDSIGLNPVDVGPLAASRQLEGLAFLNITLNIANRRHLAVRLEARRRARPTVPVAA